MKRRIIIALSLLFTLFALGSAAAVYNLRTTTANLRSLINLHEIEEFRLDLNLRVQQVLAYVRESREEFRRNIPQVISNTALMDKAIHHCHDCHHRPEVQHELDDCTRLSDGLQQRLSRLMASAEDASRMREDREEALKIGGAIQEKMQGMVDRASSTIRMRTNKAMGRIDRSYLFLLVTFGLAVTIGFFVARSLMHSITGPIESLLTATRQLTEGKLGYQAKSSGPKEFRTLFKTFNAMSASLATKELENKELTTNLRQKVEELKRTQKHLVETEKLTAIGTLASGIAHDFNNLLCGIISNITLLKKSKGLEAENTEVLEVIEKAGLRAADLVQQLLTFSRQTVETVQPVYLNLHINNISRLIRSGLSNRIKVQIDLDPNLPVIHGDPAKLEQVILNLCVNARDAMPDGGELTISTRAVEFNGNFASIHPEAERGRYVALNVADTGSGMADKVRTRIFEPFFTTKPFGQGTGLGLAMVHGIVKGHHGFCLVESELEKGSSFTVYLPVTSTPAPHPVLGKVVIPDNAGSTENQTHLPA